MTDRDWLGRVEEFAQNASAQEPAAIRPRRSRGPTVAACTALVLLCSMCLRSSWGGEQIHAMSVEDQEQALTMPPSMVSEEKRRAVVSVVHKEIRERINLLRTISAEDSQVGEDARRALENTRAAIGD